MQYKLRHRKPPISNFKSLQAPILLGVLIGLVAEYQWNAHAQSRSECSQALDQARSSYQRSIVERQLSQKDISIKLRSLAFSAMFQHSSDTWNSLGQEISRLLVNAQDLELQAAWLLLRKSGAGVKMNPDRIEYDSAALERHLNAKGLGDLKEIALWQDLTSANYFQQFLESGAVNELAHRSKTADRVKATEPAEASVKAADDSHQLSHHDPSQDLLEALKIFNQMRWSRLVREQIERNRDEWLKKWIEAISQQAYIHDENEPLQDFWQQASNEALARVSQLTHKLFNELDLQLLKRTNPKEYERIAIKALDFSNNAKFLNGPKARGFFPEVQCPAMAPGICVLELADGRTIYDSHHGTRLLLPKSAAYDVVRRTATFSDIKPIILLSHGLGTNVSHATSNLSLIERESSLAAANVIAMDMAPAGLAVSNLEPSLPTVVANWEHQLEIVKAIRDEATHDGPKPPIIVIGRSASSAHLSLHSLMTRRNDVTRVLMSFSNWRSIEQQITEVLNQVAAGIYTIDQRALDFVRSLYHNITNTSQLLPAPAWRNWNLGHLSTVATMSVSDDEYGIEGIVGIPGDRETGMLGLRDTHFPLMAVYAVPDPLFNTVFSDYQGNAVAREAFKHWFPFKESTHMQLSPRTNVGPREALQEIEVTLESTRDEPRVFRFRRFGSLPPELWPKPLNQSIEINAVGYAMLDLNQRLLPVYERILELAPTDSDEAEELRHMVRRIRRETEFLDHSGHATYIERMAKVHGLDSELIAGTTENYKWARGFFKDQQILRRQFIAQAQHRLAADPIKGPMLGWFDEKNHDLPASHTDFWNWDWPEQVKFLEDYHRRDLRMRFLRISRFVDYEFKRRLQILTDLNLLLPADYQNFTDQAYSPTHHAHWRQRFYNKAR